MACYEFIKARGKENIVYAFCDRNYNEISQIDGKRVISFEEARDCKMPFLISVVEAAEEIKSMITKAGCDWINLEELSLILGEDRVKINHDFCSFFHIEGMDDYFESEYYGAVTPQIRQAGNRLSGLTETAYASLLA